MNLPPLYLLQTLASFHENRTVAAAAENLGATQPTVTRQLQQLEDWAQAPLFEMRGRNKFLTEYGKQLAVSFIKRFGDLELEVTNTRHHMTDPSRQVLRIGARREILIGYFGNLEFAGHLDLAPMGSEKITEEIAKQTIDIAVVQLNIDTDAYVAKPFFTSAPVLLMPKRWSAEPPALQNLERLCLKHPFCTFHRNPPYLSDVQRELKFASTPAPKVVVNDWLALEDRVHRQMGWTLAPDNIARKGRDYWQVKMPNGTGSQTFYMYTRRSLSRLAWFRDLLTRVRPSKA
jgi:DNA-binding transcriptional LysR family regulator